MNKLGSKPSKGCNPLMGTTLQIRYLDLIKLTFREESIRVCQGFM